MCASGRKQRREEHEALNVVEVEVGQEDVDAVRLGREREAEAADAGACVEHHERAVGQRDRHARGVAPVAAGLPPRRRHRPASTPDRHLQVRPPRRRVTRRSPSPCVPDMVTIGIAVTWISCSRPSRARMRKRPSAGRLRRRATVSGSSCQGSAGPRRPADRTPCPSAPEPAGPSSKRRPSSAPAASL